MLEFWNRRYAENRYAYGTEPNDFFRSEIDALPAGRLLLPGEGEGRNAVYASGRGWTVDAVDYSEEGARKTRLLADGRGVSVSYTVQDLAEFRPSAATYDAVALLFVHLPPELRTRVHTAVTDALRPGGVLLLEAFTPAQLSLESGGPKDGALLYTAEQLRHEFAAMDIMHIEELRRDLHEGPYHEGTAAVVQLRAVKR